MRRTKWIVLIVAVLFFGALASQSSKFEGVQKNESSSWLPGDAESLRALEAVQELPGGELAPAVVVFERPGGLTDADKARIADTRERLNRDRAPLVLEAQEPVFSPNGAAALIVQPVQPGEAVGDTFEVALKSISDRAGESRDGLEVRLTGAAGYSYDAIKVFGGVNGPLLLAAASIVLVLLIVIYRSPIFWMIPFFAVVLAEGASRGAGYLLAEAGVTINGQAGGILPVLVFGAGTDYALLLVSRYREELRRHEDKHDAVDIALRSAGPAIVASGLTVIAALLTLSIADVNSTAGLGPVGAVGIALAMISMLTVLPALLAITGRNAFWSPGLDTIPHVGQAGSDETQGFWRRVGDRVAQRPRVGVARRHGRAARARGQRRLRWTRARRPATCSAARWTPWPARRSSRATSRRAPPRRPTSSSPTRAASKPSRRPRASSARCDRARAATAACSSCSRCATRPTRPPRWTRSRGCARRSARATLVGGPTAQEYDLREAATRDNWVIIPLTLVVVFLILVALLRALVAPLLLIASVILSFLAALGAGIFVSDHIFGFTGVAPTLPLLAFVFLVALGIDYNIFLMARVREEAVKHGTREGTLRGLAVTGAVITGAGIVLAGTFGALAVLPLVVLTQIGFIVAFGVLLDTFVVRSVIVPAAVIDVGRPVWWPSRLAKRYAHR